MSEKLSSRDRFTLATIALVRGLRADQLINYPQLKFESIDAARKALDRLCDKGFLAKSSLPNGRSLYRLSSKGVAITGAPPAYAASPSTGIAAEMLSVSALACRTDQFLFLTKAELEALIERIASQAEKPKLTSRFVLRPVTKGNVTELHLHAFMAELRPAADLARRVGVVLSNLRNSAVLRDLLQLGLLGFTIVVPSGGVKSSLERNHFEVETSVAVVEELQDLITH